MLLTYRLFILLLFLILPQLSYSNNLQGQRFGEWGVKCEDKQGKNTCYLQQVLSGNGKHLMTTVIGYGDGRQFPTFIVELPKEVNIDQGVQFKVDRYNPVSFEGRCDSQVCRAGFVLDNPLTQQIGKGKKGLIAFKKHGQNEPEIFPIDLNGIRQGLPLIKKYAANSIDFRDFRKNENFNSDKQENHNEKNNNNDDDYYCLGPTIEYSKYSSDVIECKCEVFRLRYADKNKPISIRYSPKTIAKAKIRNDSSFLIAARYGWGWDMCESLHGSDCYNSPEDNHLRNGIKGTTTYHRKGWGSNVIRAQCHWFW